MDHITAKRNTSILLKVTQQEKEQIAKNAAAFGGSISEFIRHQTLHPDIGPTNGAQMQAIARELCYLSEAVNKINDAELRHNLEERIKNIWQPIE